MARTLIVLGATDTKAAELAFLVAELRALGWDPSIVDLALPRDADKVAAMDACAASAIADLAHRDIAGVVALGGAVGTSIAMRVMRELPFGLPKVMVTTLPFDPRPHLGASDITLFPTVVDLLGASYPVRTVLRNAAAALAAMATVAKIPIAAHRVIGATSLGVTTPAVLALQREVERMGGELVSFHANGSGGAAFEQWIARGAFAGIIDLTTSELTSELFGGVASAGQDRLRTAARMRVPQIIVPGGLDFVSRGPLATLSAADLALPHFQHSPTFTHVRIDAAGMRIVARELAARVGTNAIVAIPTRGFSAEDRVGRTLYDPDADAAFTAELVAHHVAVVEIDAHVNDEAFATRVCGLLFEILDQRL